MEDDLILRRVTGSYTPPVQLARDAPKELDESESVVLEASAPPTG